MQEQERLSDYPNVLFFFFKETRRSRLIDHANSRCMKLFRTENFSDDLMKSNLKKHILLQQSRVGSHCSSVENVGGKNTHCLVLNSPALRSIRAGSWRLLQATRGAVYAGSEGRVYRCAHRARTINYGYQSPGATLIEK